MEAQVVREPVVAGIFYPEDPATLQAQVDALLRDARSPALAPKALIVPHAGYPYSGAVAAHGFASIGASAWAGIERVVLLGPAHLAPVPGLALPKASVLRTPLGDVPVDGSAAAAIETRSVVMRSAFAHAHEHSLEVQLPILQRLQAAPCVVPLLAGDSSGEAVAEVLEWLWGGDETLIIVSSDLSHYHDYATAVARDAETATAIEALNADALSYASACGCIPIKGLLISARRRGMAVHRLALCNSGDAAGDGPADRERVVGYGAWALVEAQQRQRDAA